MHTGRTTKIRLREKVLRQLRLKKDASHFVLPEPVITAIALHSWT
jgi:hypothetical protein